MYTYITMLQFPIKDELKPSGPLGYMLNTYSRDYYMYEIEGIDSRERLVLDLALHIEKRGIVELREIYDSLRVFGTMLNLSNDWKAVDFYDDSYNYKDFDIYRDVVYDENAYIPVTFNTILNIEIAKKGLLSVRPLAYKLIEDKVKRYPNIREIISWLKQNDTHPEAKTALATLYIAVRQPDKAIKVYKSKESMKSYDHYNLGVIYLLEKYDLAKAQEHFNEALELVEAKYNLEVCYLYEGDFEHANQQFEGLSYPFNLDYEELEFQLIDFRYDPDCSKGDFQETAYKDAVYSKIMSFIEVEPGTLEYYVTLFSCNNLGICRYHINRDVRHATTEALEFFRRAAELEGVTPFADAGYNSHMMDEIRTRILTEKKVPLKGKDRRSEFSGIIGKSDVMQKVYENIETAAKTKNDNLVVLITGETGTGKELVAKGIHETSQRREKPFMSISCAAIQESLLENELFGHEREAFSGADTQKQGLFELAKDGSIFLDEIGEMSLQCQAKLLRVIQEREFMRVGGSENIKIDARIIFATNRNLEQAVKEGLFRMDLYYRINVFVIHLPPLRDRYEDIPLLIEHFIEAAANDGSKRLTLSEPAMELLRLHNWPGNIRELQNCIESAASKVEGEIIYSWYLPKTIQNISKSNQASEKMRIMEAYKAENGIAKNAAKRLGMPKSTFYNKVRKYKINLKALISKQ